MSTLFFVALSFVFNSAFASNGSLRVVGGHQVAPGDWRDAAGVHYNHDVGCTGVLIAPDVVLTAGHCTGGVRSVILDSTDYLVPGEEIGVAQQIEYPNSWSTYDIGVLLLEEAALTAPRMIAQDCILEDYLYDGAPVTIVGYGATDIWGTEYDTKLIEAATTVADHDCSDISSGCNRSVSPGGELGAAGGGIDACFGDSGGPLYLNTPEGDFVVGVVSRAYDYVYAPCEEGGIWVRPDAVLDWIEEVSDRVLLAPDCDRPPNQPPDPFADPIVVVSGAVETTFVDANDPNLDDTHVYMISAAPLHGLAELSAGGDLTYTADADYQGLDDITVVVTDDRGLSGTVVVEVDVRAVVDESTLLETGGCACAAGGVAGVPWLLGLVPLILRRRRHAGC
jgi:hypothetical protein